MTTVEKVTIVTPTFNRGYILKNCYESLSVQTSTSFIWMIIDDGSSDNTEEIVENWIKENKVNILYFKKANGGKASALNLALSKVTTDYFVCLDSDDTFSSNAIELAVDHLDSLKNNSLFCGILALRTGTDGVVLGGKQIPKGIREITLPELNSTYKINSELICFYKSEVVTKFRFPEIPNEKFISPAYLEYEIGRQYKFSVSREIYCYCEYLADGLTKNKRKIIKNNPIGYTLVKRQSFELSNDLIMKIKHCIMYICGCILSQDKSCIKKSPNKMMTFLLYPVGWVIYKKRFHS